jgi:hypothetical protein
MMDPAVRARLWAAAAVIAALSAAALIFQWLPSPPDETGRDHLPQMDLYEPKGLFDQPPAVFRWEPVTGASHYRLTLSDQDTIWPLVKREVEATSLELTESERRAYAAPRKYQWEVEALVGDEPTRLAHGTAYFAIVPPGAAPSPPEAPD